jgi:hypothetical protein
MSQTFSLIKIGLILTYFHALPSKCDFQNCKELKEPRIKRLSPEILKNFTHSNILDVSHIGLEIIEPCFKNASHLIEIYINHNEISELTSNIFSGCKKLQILEINRNKIEIVNDGAFVGLSELRVLELSGNQISSIFEPTFDPLKKLEKILLSGNKMKTLKARIFLMNKNLEIVDFSKNLIESVDGDFPEIFYELKYVNLRGNICVDRNFSASEIKEVVSTCQKGDHNPVEDLVNRNFYLMIGGFLLMGLLMMLLLLQSKISAKPNKSELESLITELHEISVKSTQTDDDLEEIEIAQRSSMNFDLTVEQNSESIKKFAKSMNDLTAADVIPYIPDINRINKRLSMSHPDCLQKIEKYDEESMTNDKTVSKISFSFRNHTIPSARINDLTRQNRRIEDNQVSSMELREIESNEQDQDDEEKVTEICQTLLDLTNKIITNVKS